MAGHRDADDTCLAQNAYCQGSGAYLSVTMSRTAPSVELWLNVRAARPSVSSSTNLQPGATRLGLLEAEPAVVPLRSCCTVAAAAAHTTVFEWSQCSVVDLCRSR